MHYTNILSRNLLFPVVFGVALLCVNGCALATIDKVQTMPPRFAAMREIKTVAVAKPNSDTSDDALLKKLISVMQDAGKNPSFAAENFANWARGEGDQEVEVNVDAVVTGEVTSNYVDSYEDVKLQECARRDKNQKCVEYHNVIRRKVNEKCTARAVVVARRTGGNPMHSKPIVAETTSSTFLVDGAQAKGHAICVPSLRAVIQQAGYWVARHDLKVTLKFLSVKGDGGMTKVAVAAFQQGDIQTAKDGFESIVEEKGLSDEARGAAIYNLAVFQFDQKDFVKCRANAQRGDQLMDGDSDAKALVDFCNSYIN